MSDVQYSFDDIVLNDATSVHATDINDSDEVVGYYLAGNSMVEGFAYVNGQMEIVSNGAFQTLPNGVNNLGEIVGVYVPTSRSPSAFGFTDIDNVFTNVEDPIAAANTTTPTAVNDLGVIVGNYQDSSSVTHGFIDNNGVFTTIDVPFAGATATYLTGVNDSGEIVGTYFVSTVSYGFTDVGGVFTTIPNSSRVNGVNASGEVSGVIATGVVNGINTTQGFTYDGTTFSLINYPGALSTSVTGLNDAGDVAGGAISESGGGVGFVAVPEAACFLAGARILTTGGEVAVERLTVGDVAISATGALRPIRWIGRRRLDTSKHPAPCDVWPIRIAAGAFGENLPRRDLWLSPGHNIAAEGALTPISMLINGVSVAQARQRNVEYWHVELDVHDVLLAEGLPAESYLDCGNRCAFDNGSAFIEAHPDFQPKHFAETCLPLIKTGPRVEALKARLSERLRARGYEIVRDADAHISFDGRRIEPIRFSETRLGFVLPAGGSSILLRSRIFVPAHTAPPSADERELGLCVERLRIDGEAAALGRDDGSAEGWREAEREGGVFARRWTTGSVPIPKGARVVTIDLGGAGYYWRDGAPDLIDQERYPPNPRPSATAIANA